MARAHIQLFFCCAMIVAAGCAGPSDARFEKVHPKVDVGPFDLRADAISSEGDSSLLPGKSPLLQLALLGGELQRSDGRSPSFFGLATDVAGSHYLVLGSDDEPEMWVEKVAVVMQPAGVVHFTRERSSGGEGNKSRDVMEGTLTPLGSKLVQVSIQTNAYSSFFLNPLPTKPKIWQVEATVAEREKKPNQSPEPTR